MMNEHLYLANTPIDEECVQLGSTEYDYYKFARIEAKAYINQLKRSFKTDKVDIRTKTELHDFGSYLSVVVYFDDNDIESATQAYEIENNEPIHWDTQAKEELKAAKYPIALILPNQIKG